MAAELWLDAFHFCQSERLHWSELIIDSVNSAIHFSLCNWSTCPQIIIIRYQRLWIFHFKILAPVKANKNPGGSIANTSGCRFCQTLCAATQFGWIYIHSTHSSKYLGCLKRYLGEFPCSRILWCFVVVSDGFLGGVWARCTVGVRARLMWGAPYPTHDCVLTNLKTKLNI